MYQNSNNYKRKRTNDWKNYQFKTKIRKPGEKETYKNWGILEADTTKNADVKEKNLKDYLRKTSKLLKKIQTKNLIKRIHAWAADLVRLS